MTAPIGIQRRRIKGWRKPENTVIVDRTSKRWGNPYFPGCGLGFGNIIDGHPVRWRLENNADAVRHFREYLRVMKRDEPDRFLTYIEPLRGKNLACTCKIGDPCHRDVLLEIANA